MMGIGGIIGSVLLLAAAVLLLITSISSSLVRQISFLDVSLGARRFTFGVYGYCIDTDCTPRQLGYDLPLAQLGVQGWTYENITGLTKALVLHPIATGLAVIALVITLFAERVGYLLPSILVLLAFLSSVAALAFDFAIFAIIRNEVNTRAAGATASFGNAIWLSTAAAVILALSFFVMVFSCCAARKRERYGGKF